MGKKLRIFFAILLMIIVVTGCTTTNDALDTEVNETNDNTTNKEVNEGQKETNNETKVTMSPEKFNVQTYNLQSINLKNIDEDDYRLSRELVSNNRVKLMDNIRDNSIVVLFSDYVIDDMKYKYTPNRNFYYFTGIDRENFVLLITKVENEVNEYLFAMDVPQVNKWTGKMVTIHESVYYSGITNILELNSFESFFDSLVEHKDIDNVYVDMEFPQISEIIEKNDNINESKERGELFAIDVYNKHKDKEIISIGKIAAELRSVKNEEEIENIKRAIWITGEGIKEIMKNAESGMMEYEIEAYFDFKLGSLGAKEHAFPTIAASGENATILHYPHNDDMADDGELILFDLGSSYGYYSSDISRTIPVNGKFTERQKEIYNIVLKAQIEIMEAVKPGISLRELNEKAREILTSELIKIGLIKSGNELWQYYPHAVTHSLGLDTHDPINSEPLKPGMVITIEPGVYIEEEGLGIRIEDDVLVTKDGYINLSEDIIKTVEEIENFMKSN